MIQETEIRDFVHSEVRTLKFIVRRAQPITTKQGITNQTSSAKKNEVKAEVLAKQAALRAAIAAKAAQAQTREAYLAAQFPEDRYVDRG